MRSKEQLIKEALFFSQTETQIGGELEKYWYRDLLPDEKEVFDAWVKELVKASKQFVETWGSQGETFIRAYVDGFKDSDVMDT